MGGKAGENTPSQNLGSGIGIPVDIGRIESCQMFSKGPIFSAILVYHYKIVGEHFT
jgi:hypothetical protein